VCFARVQNLTQEVKDLLVDTRAKFIEFVLNEHKHRIVNLLCFLETADVFRNKWRRSSCSTGCRPSKLIMKGVSRGGCRSTRAPVNPLPAVSFRRSL
jgi:hypothetical protein